MGSSCCGPSRSINYNPDDDDSQEDALEKFSHGLQPDWLNLRWTRLTNILSSMDLIRQQTVFIRTKSEILKNTIIEKMAFFTGAMVAHHKLISDLQLRAKLAEQDHGDYIVESGVREYLAMYRSFSENMTSALKIATNDVTKAGMEDIVETLRDLQKQALIIYENLKLLAEPTLTEHKDTKETTDSRLSDNNHAIRSKPNMTDCKTLDSLSFGPSFSRIYACLRELPSITELAEEDEEIDIRSDNTETLDPDWTSPPASLSNIHSRGCLTNTQMFMDTGLIAIKDEKGDSHPSTAKVTQEEYNGSETCCGDKMKVGITDLNTKLSSGDQVDNIYKDMGHGDVLVL